MSSINKSTNTDNKKLGKALKRKLGDGFSYDIVYNQFKHKFTQYFSDAILYNHPRTSASVELCIKQILSGEPMNYAVIKKNGKNILILRKGKSDGIVQVIGAEDSFDVILEAHRVTQHGGEQKMIQWLLPKYVIPDECIHYFAKICNVCNVSRTNKHRMETSIESKKMRGLSDKIDKPLAFNRISQIHTIQMYVSDNNFKYVLVYTDEYTSYVILRPMISLTKTETSVELLKIFADYGTPKILKVFDHNEKYFIDVLRELGKTWPTQAIQLKSLTQKCTTRVSGNLVGHLLKKWMQSSKNNNWAIACHMIQWSLNNAPYGRADKTHTPYIAVYGAEPNQIKPMYVPFVGPEIKNPVELSSEDESKKTAVLNKTKPDNVVVIFDDDEDKDDACIQNDVASVESPVCLSETDTEETEELEFKNEFEGVLEAVEEFNPSDITIEKESPETTEELVWDPSLPRTGPVQDPLEVTSAEAAKEPTAPRSILKAMLLKQDADSSEESSLQATASVSSAFRNEDTSVQVILSEVASSFEALDPQCSTSPKNEDTAIEAATSEVVVTSNEEVTLDGVTASTAAIFEDDPLNVAPVAPSIEENPLEVSASESIVPSNS